MLDKIIKKILKVFSLTVVFLTLLPLLATGVMQIPSVQDTVVGKALHWLSTELGTEIQYQKVSIPSFNKIRFNQLYIADNNRDTLVFAEEATITTPVFFSLILKTDPNQAIIRKLELQRATLNFVIDSTSTLNFRYIIDYIKSGKTKEEKKPFRIRKIALIDSRYNMLNYTSAPDSNGISFSNLHLSDFQLELSNLEVFNDTINMDIGPMSFTDHSGFRVKEFTTHMELSPKHMLFTQLKARTPDTDLNAKSIGFRFDQYAEFKPPTLFNKVIMSGNFDKSRINFKDIGYFTDVFRNYDQKVVLSGKFRGTLSNFKGGNMQVGWGLNSRLNGDFSINGLPHASETFLIFDLNELTTSASDISSFTLPGNKNIRLPKSLKRIEGIAYKGNFTGFLNDFVAHGELNTNLGSMVTDIMISPDTSSRTHLSGSVSTHEFELGALLENEQLNTISVDAGIEATLTKGTSISANIEGHVSQFDLIGYRYQNIKVNGHLADMLFNGTLSVDDPSLVMDFDGLIDMASEVRTYDFNLDVIDANLHALNISDSDTNYHASFLLQANASGKGIDDLNGNFHLLNSLFTKSEKQIQIYDLHLTTKNTAHENALEIKSDILNATIMGQYRFSELKPKVQNYLHHFMPKWIAPDTTASVFSKNTRMDFDIKMKRTQSIFDFFYPDYLFAENSVIRGHYYPDDQQQASITLVAPELKYQGNSWKGLVLNLSSADSLMDASVGCQKFTFNNQLSFDNFTLQAYVQNSHIDFSTRWMNWDTTLYKGKVSGQAALSRMGPYSAIDIILDSTELTIADSLWILSAFQLGIDTSGITIQDFKIGKSNQSIAAHGVLSDIPGDTLHFAFNNFDLNNLNLITQQADLELGGILNGTGNMTGKNKNPLFFSGLTITNLEINQEAFGHCHINSLWNNRKQSLNIDAKAKRGKLTMLSLAGDYFPAQNGRMDFNIELNRLKTNIFNPFMEGIFSDIRGYASGELELTGVRGKPNLAGELYLQKNAFTVDYLKTRYSFTSRLEIANNNIILNNLELFDKEGNVGIINGMIRTEYLRDISLNLGITIDNLLCMDTRQIDNEYFFGTAYATGNVKIKGDPATLHFTIDAETNSNTRMFIPLSETSEVSDYTFIQFVRTDTSDTDAAATETVQKVNMDGIQMDFNLDVTPDAEVQIIFDPTVGDIIKARGNGKIHMSINTLGTFDMVGDYDIEEGDYLFTLQNIINKKFKIEDGSTLRWTGDPFNADIDITTVYRTKTSLPSLSAPVAESSSETAIEGEEDTSTPSKQSRVTVDCQLFLSGKLMAPDIRYNITLPLAEDETRERLKSMIQTEEDLSKQFLFLMVMNQFLLNQGTNGASGNLASSNAGELLSNQLSNWLSQISNDFDLGFTYRPGDNVSDREVELALSTQLFNDRLSIDGSVDMQSEQAKANASGFVGDFDLDYKLNEKGKVRLHAYSRSNDNVLELSSPTTQGFGVFFKEDFNTLGELTRRYWAILSGNKRKTKKAAEENQSQKTKEQSSEKG